MTLQEAQNKVLNVARAEISYHEGYNNYIKYAENSWDNQFYGWELQNQPWCDVFVDWCFCQAFGITIGAAITYQTVGQGSALCSASMSYYQVNGAFYKYPQICDQVFFQNGGQIGHTGLVESVEGEGENWTSFTTIEGNTSDSVARRVYKRGDSKVAGFGRPKWSLVTGNSTSTNTSTSSTPTQKPTITPISSIFNSPIIKKYHSFTYNVKINLLKENDSGPQVSSVQELLKGKGFNCEITGIFDAKTVEALKEFQTKANLSPDGEFGGETFSALWNYS